MPKSRIRVRAEHERPRSLVAMFFARFRSILDHLFHQHEYTSTRSLPLRVTAGATRTSPVTPTHLPRRGGGSGLSWP